jgi:hypothetical protein
MLVVCVLGRVKDTLNSKIPVSLMRMLCFSLLRMRAVTSFLGYMGVFFDDIIEMERKSQLTRFVKQAGGWRWRAKRGGVCWPRILLLWFLGGNLEFVEKLMHQVFKICLVNSACEEG